MVFVIELIFWNVFFAFSDWSFNQWIALTLTVWVQRGISEKWAISSHICLCWSFLLELLLPWLFDLQHFVFLHWAGIHWDHNPLFLLFSCSFPPSTLLNSADTSQCSYECFDQIRLVLNQPLFSRNESWTIIADIYLYVDITVYS